MLAQYGENFITQRKVYQWLEGFQSDREGLLTTSRMVDNAERINDLVQEDRRI